MMPYEKEAVLAKVATLLSEQEITWALGGSMLLYHSGVTDKVETIELVVVPDDFNRLDAVLSALGEKLPRVPSQFYATRFFNKYVIDGLEFAVMSGLMLHFKGFLYRYRFNREAIVSMLPIGDVFIPCTALEDWYVLYQMMPWRQDRVEALELYFASHGLQHPERFDVLRRQPLPPAVLTSILRFIGLARA